MASSARALRTVKPHIPSIKFPIRRPAEVASASQSIATPSSKPTEHTSHHSALDFSQLPPRYARLRISEEQQAFILRGGPE